MEEKMPEATTEASEVEDVEMEDREEAEPVALKDLEMDSALDEAKEGVVPTASTLPAAEPVSAPTKGPEVVMFDVARLKELKKLDQIDELLRNSDLMRGHLRSKADATALRTQRTTETAAPVAIAKIQDIEVIVDGYRRMKTIGTEGPCQGPRLHRR